jgi:hypothetical protein
MIPTVLTIWLLFFEYGLALKNPSLLVLYADELDTCLAQYNTAGWLPLVTIIVESENVNISSVIQFSIITTAALYPTTSAFQNISHISLSSNQTSSGSIASPTTRTIPSPSSFLSTSILHDNLAPHTSLILQPWIRCLSPVLDLAQNALILCS